MPGQQTAGRSRKWVVWGRLSSYKINSTGDGGDVCCIDDDGFVGEVEFTTAPTANGSGTFVTGGTGTPNLKCK